MLSRDCAILDILNAGQKVTSIAASFNSDPIDLGSFIEAILFLPVTAHAGTTPTLDAKIQYSSDKINWADSGDAATQVTTTNSLTFKKLTANFGKWVRVVFTIGGTASPTYTVTPSIAAKN